MTEVFKAMIDYLEKTFGYASPRFDVQSVCGASYFNPLDPHNFCDCPGDGASLNVSDRSAQAGSAGVSG